MEKVPDTFEDADAVVLVGDEDCVENKAWGQRSPYFDLPPTFRKKITQSLKCPFFKVSGLHLMVLSARNCFAFSSPLCSLGPHSRKQPPFHRRLLPPPGPLQWPGFGHCWLGNDAEHTLPWNPDGEWRERALTFTFLGLVSALTGQQQ